MSETGTSRPGIGGDWRTHYAENTVSEADAADLIESGNRIYLPLSGTRVIHHELAKRMDLKDVEIHLARPGAAQIIDFTNTPDWSDAFSFEHELFIGDESRWATDERKSQYNPVIFSLQFKPVDEDRPEARPVDVLILPVSPPNPQGFEYRRWKLRSHHQSERKEQDADQDYPQSRAKIQIICLRSGSLG